MDSVAGYGSLCCRCSEGATMPARIPRGSDRHRHLPPTTYKRRIDGSFRNAEAPAGELGYVAQVILCTVKLHYTYFLFYHVSLLVLFTSFRFLVTLFWAHILILVYSRK